MSEGSEIFEEDAKPCPFCSSERIKVYENEANSPFGKCLIMYALCKNCSARGPYNFRVDTEEEDANKAIKNWNERPL